MALGNCLTGVLLQGRISEHKRPDGVYCGCVVIPCRLYLHSVCHLDEKSRWLI